MKNRGLKVRRFLDKGKMAWSKKIKKKPSSCLVRNGSLNLEKKRGGVSVGVSSHDESISSSEFDMRKSLFLDSYTEKGRCSKDTDDEVGGLERPKKVTFNLQGDFCNTRPSKSFQNLELCVDLGPLEVSPIGSKGLIHENPSAEDGLVLSSDSMNTKEAFVMATIEAEINNEKGEENSGNKEGMMTCAEVEGRQRNPALVETTSDEEATRALVEVEASSVSRTERDRDSPKVLRQSGRGKTKVAESGTGF